MRIAVAIGSSLLTLAVLVALSMAIEGPVHAGSNWVASRVGAGGLAALFVVALAALTIGERWYTRRDQRRRYATTGIIDVERPHPWPMWIRVAAFVPITLGIVAAVIASLHGI